MLKKILSVFAAAALLPIAVYADETVPDNALHNTVLTADKTAQWTRQEAAENYDLRIHGWETWENAAYIGFTLPESFAPDKLVSATLKLDTMYVNASGTAYLYQADHDLFETGIQYEGGNAPSYAAEELLSFTSPDMTGEFDIDITELIRSAAPSSGVAFRMDVKSQNINTGWVIGSLTNGGEAPELILDYGTGERLPGTIENPKFADALNGWTVEGTAGTADGALVIRDAARVSQRVTGIEDGVYDLSAKAMTSNITGTAYLYAKANGTVAAKTAIPQSYSYMHITVPEVEVRDGELEIGVYVSDKNIDTVSIDDLTLTRSASARLPFLKGGEISKLTYVEEMGAKFYREDGTEGDALQIMAENGFNLARIRLLDDPGKGHGQGGYYLPEYYLSLEDCLDLARRAKSKGMQIEFTIAYSDYWVDGEKQMVPHKWQDEIDEKGLTGEELISYLEDKVYEYTKSSMQAMVDQGTTPEYVSIGNEIQAGILFNEWNNSNGLYYKAEPLARFLNAGARAVRETAPEAKIILHSDNGGKVRNRSVFMNVLNRVDFDVIGVSFYPFYNADVSIDTVVNEFNALINTYDKDVIIMETGYNWNAVKADGWSGQLKNSGYYTDIYGETQNGQRAFLTELYAKLKTVMGGRCIGDLYWDPVMVHSSDWKIGWAVRESDDGTDSNVVPNSTIFDFDGKAVEGQKAMRDNCNQSDKLILAGKINTVFGSSIPNARLTLEISGEEYPVVTDAYGEYVAAVDYPDSETLSIRVSGFGIAQRINVPRYGHIVSKIDLTAEGPNKNEPKFELKHDRSYTAVFDDPYSAMYVAEYDGEGRLINVSTRSSGILNVRTSKVKVFVWDKENPEPKGNIISADVR